MTLTATPAKGEFGIKSFAFVETKAEAVEGTKDFARFTGRAATYQRDAYGDVIAPGAFAPSIREQRGKVPLFYDHNRDAPIGITADLAEDARGLYVEGMLALKTTYGANAYALLEVADRVEYRYGLSIGFVPVEIERNDATGERLIKEIDLWEISLTPFPAGKNTRVETINKSMKSVEQILRDVGGCSKDVAKLTASRLQPYLSLDSDGNRLQQGREARSLESYIAIFRAIRTVRNDHAN